MWERAHVGFGGIGRMRQGPCMKQCARQKHCYPQTPLGSDPTSRVSQCCTTTSLLAVVIAHFNEHVAPSMRGIEGKEVLKRAGVRWSGNTHQPKGHKLGREQGTHLRSALLSLLKNCFLLSFHDSCRNKDMISVSLLWTELDRVRVVSDHLYSGTF